MPDAQPAQPGIDINALTQQIGAHVAQQVRAQVAPIANEVAQLKQATAAPRGVPPAQLDELNSQFLSDFLNKPLKQAAEIAQTATANAVNTIEQRLAARDAAQQAYAQNAAYWQQVIGANPDIADVVPFVEEGWNASPNQAPGFEQQRAADAVNWARQKKQYLVDQTIRAKEQEAARQRQVSSPVGQQYGAPATNSPEGQALLRIHESDGMAHLAELQARQNALKETGLVFRK